MKNNPALYIIIAALAVLFICQWYLVKSMSKASGENNATVRRDSLIIEHRYPGKDTHTIEKHFLESQPIYNNYYLHNTIDTAAVIRDYYAHKIVRDSITDSLGIVKISLLDTLSKNDVMYRKWSYRFLKPYQVEKKVTETKETVKYASGLYIGPRVGFGMNNKSISQLGVDLDYMTRKNGFGIGYNLLDNSVQGKITFKIGK